MTFVLYLTTFPSLFVCLATPGGSRGFSVLGEGLYGAGSGYREQDGADGDPPQVLLVSRRFTSPALPRGGHHQRSVWSPQVQVPHVILSHSFLLYFKLSHHKFTLMPIKTCI